MVFIGQQFFLSLPVAGGGGGREVGFCERISAGNFNCMSGDKSKAKNIFPFIFYFPTDIFSFSFWRPAKSQRKLTPHIHLTV
jgi:hypothetical protein